MTPPRLLFYLLAASSVALCASLGQVPVDFHGLPGSPSVNQEENETTEGGSFVKAKPKTPDEGVVEPTRPKPRVSEAGQPATTEDETQKTQETQIETPLRVSERSKWSPRFGLPATKKDKTKFVKDETVIKSLLTIDGGGLRCVLVVEVLTQVEAAIRKIHREHYGYSESAAAEMKILLSDYFTGFSGVNCGAWIASYLASNCGNFHCRNVLQSREVRDAFRDVEPGSVLGLRVFFSLFAGRMYPRLPRRSPISLVRRFIQQKCLVGLLCPVYPVSAYRNVLSKFFDTQDLSNVRATLILPVYELTRRVIMTVASDSMETHPENKTYTFVFEGTTKPLDPRRTNDSHPTGYKVRKDLTYSLLDITQAAGTRLVSHAAHRFTPLNNPRFELLCLDTSLLFNNPSIVAITVMSRMSKEVPLRYISLLSIGTGMVDGSLADRAEAGMLQWNMLSRDFLAVVIHGGSELVQTQVDAFLYAVVGSQYYAGKMEYSYGQYLRIQASASADTPRGQALMSSDEYIMYNVLSDIGKETGKTFAESIYAFIKYYVMEAYEDDEERINRWLSPYWIMNDTSDDE